MFKKLRNTTIEFDFDENQFCEENIPFVDQLEIREAINFYNLQLKAKNLVSYHEQIYREYQKFAKIDKFF